MLQRFLYVLTLVGALVATKARSQVAIATDPRPVRPPVPAGTGAPLPPGLPTMARGLLPEPLASPIRILRNSALGAGAAGRQAAASPTVLVHGAVNSGVALATGNRYAALSVDGGSFWTHIDPVTQFPAADGGFAGNQWALHVPSVGIDVWGLQYAYGLTTRKNTIRLAVAKSQTDLASLTFHTYDFTPVQLGFPDRTWLDAPHLAVSSTMLWFAADCYHEDKSYVGSVVWRAPLSQIAANAPLTLQSYRGTGGGWRLVAGAQSTMFWFQHLTTSRLRVYRWPEASGSVTFDDRDVGLWYQGPMDGSGPGGRNWLQRADQRPLAAWVARGRLGVMWHSKEGGSFPRPFTRVVELDEATRDVARQSTIWHPEFAWAFPSAGVNAKGFVAGSICYGGGTVHPGTAVWIADDLDPFFEPLQNLVVAAGQASPSGNAWGDYLSSAAHPGRPLTWVASALSMSGAGGDADQSPRLVHFGRDRDVIGRPDLVVEVSGTSLLNPGFPAAVRSTIRNLGSTASAACASAHYLSSDATITTADLLLEAFTTPALAVDAEESRTTNFTVATATQPGPCWLGVLADRDGTVAEVDETNNAGALGVTCQPLRPDLVIDSFTPGKTQIDSGLPVLVNAVVRNRGLVGSAACTTGFYLSVDDVITTADTLLGDFTTPGLNPSGTHSLGGSVTVPASAKAGTCWLGVLADRGGTVMEAYEDNNARSQQVTCLGARPDLVAEALGAGAPTLRRSQAVSVTSTVRNQGVADSPATASGYYLSQDATITTADVLLAAFTTPALLASTPHNHGTNVTPPQSTPIGPCWLGLIADKDDALDELDETNNARALAVTCADGVPDLTPTQLDANPTALRRSATVALSSTVANRGFGTTAASESGYYLSQDATITTADVLLAAFTTPGLTPSATAQHGTNVQVPQTTPIGACWLGVLADRDGKVAELDETNNARALGVTCQDGVPDLVAVQLGASTTTLKRGEVMRPSSSLRNDGFGTTPPVASGYYLSQDQTITTADVLLAAFTTASLVPNASDNHATNVQVPVTTKLGSCWLGVIADKDGALAELDETNNARALAVICADGTPDLSVTVLLPPPPVAGATIDVPWTVRNDGTGVALPTQVGFFLGTASPVTVNDVLLGTASVPQLDLAQGHGATARLFVPYCTRAGTCFVGAIADVTQAVTELDETNNARTSSPLVCTAYAGAGRYLEFVPRLSGAAQQVDAARFVLDGGARTATLCVTAPVLPGYVYVLLWSAQPHPNLFLDAFTDLSTGLANGPVLPFWIGLLDSGGRTIPALAPAMSLPPLKGLSAFVVHTHQVFVHPSLRLVIGAGSNSVTNLIQ